MKALIGSLIFCALLIAGCGGGGSGTTSTFAPTPTPTPAPTITGTWIGTVTSSSGPLFSISGNLVQGQTQADGSILFSGTLFPAKTCFTSVTITNGKIAGNAFALIGTDSDGSVLSFTATLNALDTAIQGTYTLKAGTVCGNDNGTVVLTKQ